MIDLDKWYSAKQFAEFLGVHPISIYQSQSNLGSSKLPIFVPPGIKIGRSVRWTGAQIKQYQSTLARLSGVDVPDSLPATEAQNAKVGAKPGRPRNAIGNRTGRIK